MPENLAEIRAARKEFDDVVDEIRQVPGCADFLAEPAFADVASAVGDGPLCYLAAADVGGLALIVGHDQVEHVDLPELTLDTVAQRVQAHRELYETFKMDRGRGLQPWADDLDDITEWLWRVAMGPILGRLAGPENLVIVATGLLGLLPLHAAWRTDDTAPTGRRYAVDSVAISYVPNARSLAVARTRAAQTRMDTLLAVADPQPRPPHHGPLDAAEYEVSAAAASFHETGAVVLEGTSATASRVRAELNRASVLHFACHGEAKLHSPLGSHLVFADGELITLGDLLAIELNARLAVLSACETSVPGNALPDEVLALPTGMLQAGVAGVIASLWAVQDVSGSLLMVEFYRRWRWDGHSPAQALRLAQRWLRDTTNAEKTTALRKALAEGAGWLPPKVCAELVDELELREPDDRDEAAIHRWAVFGHVGV